MGVNGIPVAPHGLILCENEATPPKKLLKHLPDLKTAINIKQITKKLPINRPSGRYVTSKDPVNVWFELARVNQIANEIQVLVVPIFRVRKRGLDVWTLCLRTHGWLGIGKQSDKVAIFPNEVVSLIAEALLTHEIKNRIHRAWLDHRMPILLVIVNHRVRTNAAAKLDVSRAFQTFSNARSILLTDFFTNRD